MAPLVVDTSLVCKRASEDADTAAAAVAAVSPAPLDIDDDARDEASCDGDADGESVTPTRYDICSPSVVSWQGNIVVMHHAPRKESKPDNQTTRQPENGAAAHAEADACAYAYAAKPRFFKFPANQPSDALSVG